MTLQEALDAWKAGLSCEFYSTGVTDVNPIPLGWHDASIVAVRVDANNPDFWEVEIDLQFVTIMIQDTKELRTAFRLKH